MNMNQPFPSSLDPMNTAFKKEEENHQIEEFKELLKSMGITSYEENIIPMLIEFVSDYHNKILSEARTYADVSNSPKITVNHLREASLSLNKRYFSYQRSYNQDSKQSTSKLRYDDEGVVLPNHINMLSGTDYQLPSQ